MITNNTTSQRKIAMVIYKIIRIPSAHIVGGGQAKFVFRFLLTYDDNTPEFCQG